MVSSRTYYNSHPPRRKFSPSLSGRTGGRLSKRHHRSEEAAGEDDRDFYIVVRGGIYEVDLNQWKCHSIYWPSPGLGIMRGTWFHDQVQNSSLHFSYSEYNIICTALHCPLQSWQPVDCEHADRIEAEHIKRFLGHKMADYVWDPRTSSRRVIQVSCHAVLLL